MQHNEEVVELSWTGQRQLDKEINQPQHVVSNLVARMLSNCKTVLIREQRGHFQDEMTRDNDLYTIHIITTFILNIKTTKMLNIIRKFPSSHHSDISPAW